MPALAKVNTTLADTSQRGQVKRAMYAARPRVSCLVYKYTGCHDAA